MNSRINEVMSTLKGSMLVDVVPTKENVNYDRVYYYTKDPGFGRFSGDRGLDKKHVKEIQKAIETGKYKEKYIAPIRIDINTLFSEDGKHRYNAFIQAWNNGCNAVMRVLYEDLPVDVTEAQDVITEINSTQKNWGVPDYEHRLKAEGNTHMIKIEEFGKTHPICQKKDKKGEVVGCYPRYVYAILLGRNATKEVKNGTIKISNKDLEFGEKIYKELEQMVSSLDYEMNSWFESFAHAWYEIRKKDHLYSKVIDKIGFDVFCKKLPDIFEGYHPITRKSEWLGRFRDAIWDIKEEIS